MANTALLQASPKALMGVQKSPCISPSRDTYQFPHFSSFLTNQISINSVKRSFNNSIKINSKCCTKSFNGEFVQAEKTHMEKNVMQKQGDSEGPVNNQNDAVHWSTTAAFSGVVALVPFLVDPEKALAASGEFGLLEGRSAALIHPIAMGSLFVYTLWAGYLGWQWRRVRTIQDEINELKKQVKPLPKEESDAPAPPSPIQTKIQQLTEERKQLLKGSFRDRHFNAGSILLGFGVLEAVGGGINTWMRSGKLFPGPHLFAGAGITVLWALAAALVPAMQKGNDVARSLHIALNSVNVVLFIWQIPTGIEIVLKVFEFTKWP
ncbi:hypothetical protein SUGI_0451350 [Cryptomeria japonica]|uniref:uncharacterized protein LOC131077985 n=1 Tax=Cryptomeria japonica TaxID=3369 RepID=UPI002408C7CB|nr:uncharacterized protein LOC131077985 [Cryptomeria japonica]GLJ23788.1 hypothetical protein SUGI_0451350 [Cryptomeria japonica]